MKKYRQSAAVSIFKKKDICVLHHNLNIEQLYGSKDLVNIFKEFSKPKKLSEIKYSINDRLM
jgi:hypothetical protein